MTAPELHPTLCAVCGTSGNAEELYAARLPEGAFEPRVFSARRAPDGVHYRMVRCATCGLVRSDPTAAPGLLADAYAASSFDYTAEVGNLIATYGRELASLEEFGGGKTAILEIGCGNGFLLQEALRQGFREVSGIEPSQDAISRAPESVRARIVCAMFEPGVFPERSFDVIAMFQVLDHLPDPRAVLDLCLTLLRPGGLLLSVHHNVRALSARVMGERSPIVDVEHTYLFSADTTRRFFEASGFTVLRAAPIWNRVSLRHVLHLAPLPDFLKRGLERLPRSFLERTVSLPLGNLGLVARRPDPASGSGASR